MPVSPFAKLIGRSPEDEQFTYCMATLMPYLRIWASPGKLQKTFPSVTWPLSLASPGTSPIARLACQIARRRNTFKPSRNGSQSRNTHWMRYKNYTANYYMLATSYPRDVLTSPTWKPSWGHATVTVLSACVPHPAELQAIYSGGRKDSPNQQLSGTSPALLPLSTPMLTQMLALKLVLGSQLATGGEPGDCYQAGKLTAGTLAGWKLLASGSSSSLSCQPHLQACTSRSLGTTEEWLKAGGRAGAETSPPTKFSSTSMPSQKCKTSISTHDMFPAKKIQQMALPTESTTTAPSSFLPLSSLHHSDNTYATLMRLSHQLSCTLYSKEGP